jgi:hypothetical protein
MCVFPVPGRLDKSFDEKLRNASILDQLSLPYPKGPLTNPQAPRNSEFFDKMYGNARRAKPASI